MTVRFHPVFLLSVSVLFAFLLVASPARAAIENVNVTIEQRTVPNAGITPNSFFYLVDTLSERITLWMTRDVDKKIPALLNLSQEKLQEAEELATADKKGAEIATQRYEKYITEAVDAAKKAQDKNQNVDALLQGISAATLEDLSSYIILATSKPAVEEAVSDTIDAIGDQQKRIIEAIQDEQKRKDTTELILQFVQDAQASIPPEKQEKIRTALHKFMNTIVGYLLEKGGALLESLSDTAKEYAKAQANRQLDKLKTEVIRSLQRMHF